jgi:signal transduction histidine kinase
MATVIDPAQPLSPFARSEDERHSLARDVHDIVGSAMTAIHLQANLALRTLEQRPAEAAEALRTIATSSQRSLHELRSILGGHRIDERLATLARLDALVAGTVAGQLQVDIRVTGNIGTLPAAQDEAAYRIVQESLTNVMRHAGATSIQLTITVTSGLLTVEVTDDGVGSAEVRPPTHQPGQGIRGMRERVNLLGGDLSAGRRASSGFSVRALLPLP